MKNFQQNLLIVLALALCGLCAFQWYEQTVQRGEITTLNGVVYGKNITIRDATNSVALLSRQVDQTEARLAAAQAAAATNQQLVASQQVELVRLQYASLNLTNEITQYRQAVNELEAKVKDAYAELVKQNAAITNLVAQRDELVSKLNQEIADRNSVVAKYNELANQIKQQTNNSEK